MYILEKEIEIKEEKQDPNIIWICWLQGFENAPELVKACLNSVKQNLPNHKIVLITNENLHEYLELPSYIEKLYEKGRIGNAHFSDLIRIGLLNRHGGIWIDATVLITSPDFINYISDLPMFLYKKIDLMRNDKEPIVASSWLIRSDGKQRILHLTEILLHEYWKKYDYNIDYFLFHIFLSLAAEKYAEEWKAMPTFNNHSPHMLQFELMDNYREERWEQLMHMSSVHKLQRYHKYVGATNYNHILDVYL